MANPRFQELLRRMPEIAEAVNAFGSEQIQQRAFDALLEEFKMNDGTGSQPTKENGTASHAAEKSPGGMSTADILAMARGGKSKSAGRAAIEPKAESSVPSAEPAKLSPVEDVKEQSHYLAGSIRAELTDTNDHFNKDNVQLLKHHGTYQQDNRDERGNKSATGKSERSYMFMVRTKIPGGKLTSDQLLHELDLADEIANSTLRITSRQGLQLHGVLKSKLHETIRRINEVQLSTLGACGDVNRNVMCCPAPYASPVYQQIQRMADDIAAHLAPRTSAYHEIWLRDLATNEDKMVAGGPRGEVIEPIYGRHYLPRKFKIGIALPHDNCIDVYTHDLGLLAITEDDRVVGYNVLVGGGMGVTPSAEKTFPALAKRLTFATCEQAMDVITAVVKVQRDFGNREDRKRARLKYLIHDWGMDRFKAKVEEYYGASLPEPAPADVHGFNDHMGWDEQGDGRVFYGLNVENGRIADNDSIQMKSAFREICRTFRPGIRLTSHQSILFTDLEPEMKGDFESILKKHHVKLTEEISTVRRLSMACVAWPTCGLSITEAERALPGIMDEFDAELAKLGLAKEEFTVRMTGCPNGCARPYNSDIGLVGKTKGKYTLFVGGRLLGNRLNFVYQDLVPEEEVVSTLSPLFVFFKQAREPGETFGDFCHRQGRDALAAWAENFTLAAK